MSCVVPTASSSISLSTGSSSARWASVRSPPYVGVPPEMLAKVIILVASDQFIGNGDSEIPVHDLTDCGIGDCDAVSGTTGVQFTALPATVAVPLPFACGKISTTGCLLLGSSLSLPRFRPLHGKRKGFRSHGGGWCNAATRRSIVNNDGIVPVNQRDRYGQRVTIRDRWKNCTA